MKKIKLNNRYNSNIWLENIQNNYWKLNAEDQSDLAYIRCIYNDDQLTSIYAIDPPGGPFLHIDMIIDNYKIVEISNDLKLKLEKQ